MTAPKGRQERKRRTYKPDMAQAREFPPNTSIEGTFQTAKLTKIRDKNTHEEKDVMIYVFRDGSGKKFAIFGAFQLDIAFSDLFEAEGGVEKCAGLDMKIERGEDSKLPGKRTMGNYQVTVWDSE